MRSLAPNSHERVEPFPRFNDLESGRCDVDSGLFMKSPLSGKVKVPDVSSFVESLRKVGRSLGCGCDRRAHLVELLGTLELEVCGPDHPGEVQVLAGDLGLSHFKSRRRNSSS